MEKQRQALLKIFQDKLRKGESLETLTLKDIIFQADTELAAAEKSIAEAKYIWKCKKCTEAFEYCWCNLSVN